MCVERVRNREKKSDRRPDGERMWRTLWWSILDPNSLALSFLPPISHLGLSIPQPVGQRKYQSLRTLIPLMGCYEVGRSERERETEREKWGGESGDRDTGRKKTRERERERERERGETVLMLSWHRCDPVSLGQARSLTIYLCVCLCRWPTLWHPSAVWCLQPWWWFMPKGAASKVSLHFGYFLDLLRVSIVCVCTGARQCPNYIS